MTGQPERMPRHIPVSKRRFQKDLTGHNQSIMQSNQRRHISGPILCVLADYQVRRWDAYHIALVMLGTLFLVEQKMEGRPHWPMLSVIRAGPAKRGAARRTAPAPRRFRGANLPAGNGCPAR